MDDESQLDDPPSTENKNTDGSTTDSEPANATLALADTFNLFKTYMDSKLENLNEEQSSGNDFDSLAKQFKKEVSVNFKHDENEMQFEFNSEILND